MTQTTVIAIDGPSGSGKSTIAKTLATELGILYIDTGAMFRALAYFANEHKVDLSDKDQVKKFLDSIVLDYQTSDGALIKINNNDLSKKIREHHVSKLASIISQIPEVRSYLLEYQRGLANSKVCVMEGRDIGTVVFPNAFLKFFITASIEVRAQRRFDQLQDNGSDSVDMQQLVKDVKKRDDKDASREVAPLKEAEDSILVDTSEMNINEVIKFLTNKVKQRSTELGLSIGN